jgi:hypothetical protein
MRMDRTVDLLAAYDAEKQLGYEFFLMTGIREQEMVHTY